jgi:hypothetical protein
MHLTTQREPKFPIESNCLAIGAEHVEKGLLGARDDRCNKRPHETRGEALTAMRGIHTDRADFREPV